MLRLLLLSALIALVVNASPRIRSRVPQLDGRIVGGQDANIEDYSYQISLLYYGRHICGGSIIGPNKVLTAAHCTDGDPASSYSIRHSSSIKGEGGVVVQVASVSQNPDYNPSTTDNDVSVLRLAEDINGSIAKAVALVDSSTPEGGRKAVCTGWGALWPGGLSPSQLQSVNLDEVDREECNNVYGEDVTASMICFASPGKDSCQGDSGGPLVADGKQVGIVSWGISCAHPKYPGVYANVAYLRSYIDNN